MQIGPIENLVPGIEKVNLATNIETIRTGINIVKNWKFPATVMINNGKIISAGTSGTASGAFLLTFKGAQAYLSQEETIIIFNSRVDSCDIACVISKTSKSVIILPEFGNCEPEHLKLFTPDKCFLLKFREKNADKNHKAKLFRECVKIKTEKDPSAEEINDLEFAWHIASYLPESIVFAAGSHTCLIYYGEEEFDEIKLVNNLTWERAIVVASAQPLLRQAEEFLKDCGVSAIIQKTPIDDQLIKGANCLRLSFLEI